MRRQPSFFHRLFEPLIHLLWPLFVGWSAIVAVLWWTGSDWTEGVGNPGLRQALAFIAGAADAGWLLLAALNVYLDLAAREGLARARVVALAIFAVSIAIGWGSVATGWPLGRVAFTDHLGARLGPVPLGWPLLWFVVVLGGRNFVLRFWPRASHATVSAAVGGIAVLTDLNLEPLATKLRLYWFWYAPGTTLPTDPGWNVVATWGVAAAALAWFAREQNVAGTQQQNPLVPWVIVIVSGVFLAGHLRNLAGF